MSEQNDEGRTWTGPLTASSPEDYEKKQEPQEVPVQEEPVQAAPAAEPAAEPVKEETEDLDTLLKQGWDIVVAKVGEDKAEDLSDEEAMAIIREEDGALYNKIVSLSPAAEPTAEEPVQEASAAEAEPAETEPAQKEPVPEETAPATQGTTALTETETRPAPAGNMEPVKNSKMRSINTSGIVGAIKCMISFFTIIRIDVDEKDMQAMNQNFWLAPVLGLFTGLVAFIVCAILELAGIGTLLAAIVALGTVYIFSKFLHFDGLADFGDGMIVSSPNREDHVRALKDSRIGAGGIGVALIVVLMTVTLYSALGGAYRAPFHNWNIWLGLPIIVLATEVLVKYAQTVAATFGNPGNGMASEQVRNCDMNTLILSSVVTLILMAIVTVIGWAIGRASLEGVTIPGWEIGLLFVVGFGIALLTGVLMAHVSNRTFGFVNGDVLGATNEISRCAILLMTVFVSGLIAVW